MDKIKTGIYLIFGAVLYVIALVTWELVYAVWATVFLGIAENNINFYLLEKELKELKE